MIAASFILLLCLLFADRGSARYKQQAALDYQKEHSLFENILFTGEAYAGAYKNQNESTVTIAKVIILVLRMEKRQRMKMREVLYRSLRRSSRSA